MSPNKILIIWQVMRRETRMMANYFFRLNVSHQMRIVGLLFFLSVGLSAVLLTRVKGNKRAHTIILGFCCFLAFGFATILSPVFWGFFLEKTGISVARDGLLTLFFSVAQIGFLFLLAPLMWVLFLSIYNQLSDRVKNPRYRLQTCHVRASFFLYFLLVVLVVWVFGIYVGVSHEILRATVRGLGYLGFTVDRMTMYYVPPEWYGVLLRAMGWWTPIFLSNNLFQMLFGAFTVFFLFPLTNTGLLLLYWKKFILTKLTRSARARSYLFMWVLANIAIFPLVYAIVGIIVWPPIRRVGNFM